MKLRPRFSLKMLFLIVGLVGVFCAYHVNWINKRHALLAKYATLKSAYNTHDGRFFSMTSALDSGTERTTPKHSFGLLRLFGESPQENVEVVIHADRVPNTGERWERCIHEDRDVAERYFPESNIDYCVYVNAEVHQRFLEEEYLK